MSYFTQATDCLGTCACVVYWIIGGSNNEWRTILYTYNCLCFLGMEILQVGNLYMISYKNMKVVEVESEDNIPPLPSIEWLLQGCKVTHVDVPSPEIKQLWLDAYERGKQEGFSPVLLAVDSCFSNHLMTVLNGMMKPSVRTGNLKCWHQT